MNTTNKLPTISSARTMPDQGLIATPLICTACTSKRPRRLSLSASGKLSRPTRLIFMCKFDLFFFFFFFFFHFRSFISFFFFRSSLPPVVLLLSLFFLHSCHSLSTSPRIMFFTARTRKDKESSTIPNTPLTSLLYTASSEKATTP